MTNPIFPKQYVTQKNEPEFANDENSLEVEQPTGKTGTVASKVLRPLGALTPAAANIPAAASIDDGEEELELGSSSEDDDVDGPPRSAPPAAASHQSSLKRPFFVFPKIASRLARFEKPPVDYFPGSQSEEHSDNT